MRAFLEQLKRRKVMRVAIVYAVVTFVIWQAAEIAFPTDPENELFCDGVTVGITSRISKIADLKVISRTSSFQYKNSSMGLREIAEALSASAIVEGDVRLVENQWRIDARLIDTANDESCGRTSTRASGQTPSPFRATLRGRSQRL